jgi:coronin-1B/1C/6
LEIAGHPDMIFSIAFNYDGSQFVTTCKDKKIRVMDSHTGEVLREGIGHEGVKPQRAIFTQDGRIITTGFSKRSERLYALRHPDNISEPIIQDELDTSNGVLFPLYDEDSGLLYLAGKGDCAIRYYEVNNEYPFVHYINTYTTSEPQRAIAFMPKRGLNSNENEINRIYKVTTKGVVDVLQFYVPRKSDLWQADLYPDTRSMAPALTAEEWAAGENAPPKLMPVNPAAAQAKPKIQVAKKANILAQLPPSTQEAPPPSQPSPTRTSAKSTPQRSVYADEEMGIVPVQRSAPQRQSAPQQEYRPPPKREPSPEAPNPMIPKAQVQLRSRAREDDGQTPGQRRAAAELERIKRESARGPGESADVTPVASRRQSTASSVASSEMSGNSGDMASEMEKIKQVLRQHERRIRMLEESLAEVNMAHAYGL